MAITNEQKSFIEKVGGMAATDMKKTKVLASLTTAQAILESAWGKSGLTVKANALFGIKASAGWTGKVYSSNTQECYDGLNFTTITALFRAYNSWEESVADHSALLTGLSRYKAVVGEGAYKTACKAIKDAGYATDPDYAAKLINIIETYNLTRFDAPASVKKDTITVVIGKELASAPAENIGDHWYIAMPDGVRVKIRDVLTVFGYPNIAWEPSSRTIVAGK